MLVPFKKKGQDMYKHINKELEYGSEWRFGITPGSGERGMMGGERARRKSEE